MFARCHSKIFKIVGGTVCLAGSAEFIGSRYNVNCDSPPPSNLVVTKDATRLIMISKNFTILLKF